MTAALTAPASARAPHAAASPDQLRERLNAISAALREPAWLRERRGSALEAYLSLPLPDRVSHLWRYSEPESFLPDGREASPPGAIAACGAVSGDDLAKALERGEISGLALLQDARAGRVQLSQEAERAGVRVLGLSEAVAQLPELIRERLGALVPPLAGKFEALNAALWSGGLLVHVPRGVSLSKPIHIRGASGPVPGTLCQRLLIVAGEASEVTVIEELNGGGRSSPAAATSNPGTSNLGASVNSVAEIFAGPGSRVRHLQLQGLEIGATLHHSQRSRLERGSRLDSTLVSLGGSLVKVDLGTILDGPGAEVEFLGFLFGSERQRFDHHTVHEHRSPRTLSNLDFKVVLKDRSRSAYTGLIRIAPEAPGSEAYQENKNLLLNDGTRAESIPELEILTDEVMCTHGATMGTLDPNEVFYLLSRAIPRPEATRMIIAGFLEPTMIRLPEELRERVRAHLESALAGI